MTPQESLAARFETLDLSAFAALPEAARSRELFVVDGLVDLCVDAWCKRIHDEVDPATIQADRRCAWDWIERRLALDREVQLQPVGYEGDEPGIQVIFELLDTAGSAYAAFLRGEVDGQDVLLGRSTGALWKRYFDNGNPWYAAINRAAASTAARAVDGDALRVLEVGGGFGSAAEALLEELGDRVGHYLFTEKAPYFFAMGKVFLQKRFAAAPWAFEKIDIEQSLAEQSVELGSYDLVHAVNVLHAVDDLGAALANLREALRPGGRILLGEAVRPTRDYPIAIEFVFQLMPEFRDVQLAEWRPTSGFLSRHDWPEALRAAGFSDVRIEPDLDRATEVYPSYSVAAIHAARPS